MFMTYKIWNNIRFSVWSQYYYNFSNNFVIIFWILIIFGPFIFVTKYKGSKIILWLGIREIVARNKFHLNSKFSWWLSFTY